MNKEALSQSSLAFIAKFAEAIKIDQEIALAAIINYHLDEDWSSIFENGEIVYFDVGRTAYRCGLAYKEHIIAQKGREHYYDNEKDYKVSTPTLSALDLSDLTKIKHLRFNGEYFRSEERSLKMDRYSFDNFEALEILEFTDHFIGTLDISNCKKLRKLSCAWSSIQSFDCSQNTVLEVLQCSNNNIKTLDLSNNPKLKELMSAGNPLEDCLLPQQYLQTPKNNPLEKLYLGDENGFVLDLSLFPNLKLFKAWNTSSQNLDFSNNLLLEVLDISKQRNLSAINIFDNHKLQKFDLYIDKGAKIEVTCNEKQVFLVEGITKHAKIKPNKDQKEFLKTFKLHQKADNHPADDSFTALDRILKNKYCDLATALMIYWRGNPNYFLRYASVKDLENEPHRIHLDDFKDLMKIEKALLKGKYKLNLIPYNPSNDEGYDNTAYTYDEKPLRSIPEEFKKAVLGKKLEGFDSSKKVVFVTK